MSSAISAASSLLEGAPVAPEPVRDFVRGLVVGVGAVVVWHGVVVVDVLVVVVCELLLLVVVVGHDEVRLTNSGRGPAYGTLALVPDEGELEPPPFDPSVPSTVEISCGPGRNTTFPSVRLPVAVSSSDSWRSSTPSVVPGCQTSSAVIPSALKPRL